MGSQPCYLLDLHAVRVHGHGDAMQASSTQRLPDPMVGRVFDNHLVARVGQYLGTQAERLL
ncbi:hypothetical protein D3C76_1376720 [compost metagenome]